MKKILLLGSAGYVKDWYAEHGARYLADGHALYAMNNSWMIDPANLECWIHSEDYFMIPTNAKPSEKQRNGWYEVVRFMQTPFYHGQREGGTMLLNSICHLLNHCFHSKQQLWLCIAGSDLIYKKDGRDHFYGKGTPDPLIMGIDNLRRDLEMIKVVAESLGHKVLNCGGQAETLLPFARFKLR